jgi:hypothetical protein
MNAFAAKDDGCVSQDKYCCSEKDFPVDECFRYRFKGIDHYSDLRSLFFKIAR